MPPGNRCSAGGVAEDRVESGFGVHRGDPRSVEVADPLLELVRTAERLLDGHLLVEREPDEQGERLGDEQPVGLVVAGERE